MAEQMFRPPVNRAMRVLDRSFFHKKIPLSAARVMDNKTISKCRNDLSRSKDVLILERFQTVRPDPTESDPKTAKKCILLRPQIDDKGNNSMNDFDTLNYQLISHHQVLPFLGARLYLNSKSQT
jgi:tRNA (guanine37-N1)-methyltransferase